MKKGIVFLTAIVALFSIVIGVVSKNKVIDNGDTDKVKVIATIYPQYDFAKQIGGDKVEVSLLLTPGTETHTYEPTPQDIMKVNNSNLFIYTGDNMEPWAEKIAKSLDSDTTILDVSCNIELKKSDHEEEEEEEEEEHHHHEHEFDPHIWLNPQNAIIMVKNIENELCTIDPDNEEYYRKNAEDYITKIAELDDDIEYTVSTAKRKKVAFGGAFAYMYFIDRYDLEYVTAYDSCGEDTEPSVSNVKKVIDYMNKNELPVVFYQEQSSGKIADSIASETGAKKLVFHTLHNVSSDELNNGESYVSLMRKNLENLKEALN